jgi:hypothetical protein
LKNSKSDYAQEENCEFGYSLSCKLLFKDILLTYLLQNEEKLVLVHVLVDFYGVVDWHIQKI